MHPKSRRMFSSCNTLQRITTHVPTPHFRKWDASSSGNTLSLRPSPVVWYSFLAEITTTLTRCSFSSFSFSVPMYVCIPKHYFSVFKTIASVWWRSQEKVSWARSLREVWVQVPWGYSWEIGGQGHEWLQGKMGLLTFRISDDAVV